MLVNTGFSPAHFKSPQSGLAPLPANKSPSGNAALSGLSTLENKALENIARHLPGMTVAGLQRLDPQEFTPQKVADRITDFVKAGLAGARARGASEEQLESMRQDAVKGVERGVREAREILEGLQLLSGTIAEQVDATERLTLDALANLAPGQLSQNTGLQTTLSVNERYQRAESLELQLLTQEGDRVTIQFERRLDTQAQARVASDGDNARALTSVSRYEQGSYRFSVEGQLNDAERQAIDNLVQDLDRLANEFFNGDVQTALTMVPDLRFDGSQLAAMEVNMTKVERYSLAQSYQQTQQLDHPEHSKPGRRLGQLLQDMNQRFNESVLEFLDQYRNTAEQIMQTLVEQDSRFKDAGQPQQQVLSDHLQRLFAAVNPFQR